MVISIEPNPTIDFAKLPEPAKKVRYGRKILCRTTLKRCDQGHTVVPCYKSIAGYETWCSFAIIFFRVIEKSRISLMSLNVNEAG